MIPDYHIHTSLCRHATGMPPDYRDAAGALGMDELCITDHSPNPDGFAQYVCMTMNDFPRYCDSISGLQDARSPTVLLGIEIEYYNDCENHFNSWLPQYSFDLVMASVHFIDDWPVDKDPESWNGVDVAGAWRRYFTVLQRMVDSGLFDVVGHLDLPKKFGHRPPDKLISELAQPVLDRIASMGMTIEINTSGLEKRAAEIYPAPFLIALALEREIPICFGSDAHAPEQVGRHFNEAIELVKDIGYQSYARYRARQQSSQLLPAP